MSDDAAPEVECDTQHPELRVPDLAAAIEFYTTKLGFRLGFTWGEPPEIAGVNLGNVQMFLLRGQPSPAACSVSFVVGDADELLEYQRGKGVEIVVPIGDRVYGLRDYRVRDLYGYELSFGHHLYNTGPRIEIERVEVPVRIERRLAALLQDLAEHKRMSVGSCLEETLLHTLDGVGPHTTADLRHIERLKKKHGIDYDSHASYRFSERKE
jgi:catechol 2,3-dioxygenase-like lactoylglutathione lyase family enzyme